jgi:hypothetical protein
MNERIRLLWEEAAKTTQGDSWEEQTKFIERFAELIVQECMSIIKQGDGLGNEDDFDKGFQAGLAMAYNRIRAQLGVEE